jgi:hypothetical protein
VPSSNTSSDEGERIGLDTDELPRAKDAFHYIADQKLVGRILRNARAAGQLVRDPNLPIRVGVLPNHMDPADWGAGYLDVHDYESPAQLHDDLHECTPQALLRDLFRPDFQAFVWHDRETLVTLDRGGTQALKEALDAQKLEPLPRVEPLVFELQKHADAWHKILSDRWLPILDDDAPRKRVLTLHEPSLNW